ncbi:hypothetical protein WJX72_008047 [[Myrmecia] bisecta]|uniref:Uncharacterized protein n=1 Tax=[Myrmecia] bisecta TaxID=41462 RepID=A0AAW1PQI2_9CHLO
MGWEHASPYEYHYERGLYYHYIHPNLICGSQPRNPQDIDQMKHHLGVDKILNLQQDKDLQYWNVDFQALQKRADDHGIPLIRRPARDFDPHSLRTMLPSVVQAIEQALAEEQTLYVHCTAGLGRAPAACIAYLYWFGDMSLDQAYKHLTDIRPCGPKREAIRGSTYDLLSGGDWDQFEKLPPEAYASLLEEDRLALQHRVISWQM